MKLVKQKGKTCLLACASMLLDEEIETLIKEIGYSGEELVFNGLRGIHIQEIQDCCLRRGFGLCLVEYDPSLGYRYTEDLTNIPANVVEKSVFKNDFLKSRILCYLKSNLGLLILADTAGAQTGHAVVVANHLVFNPALGISELSALDFNTIREVWILAKLKSNQN